MLLGELVCFDMVSLVERDSTLPHPSVEAYISRQRYMELLVRLELNIYSLKGNRPDL